VPDRQAKEGHASRGEAGAKSTDRLPPYFQHAKSELQMCLTRPHCRQQQASEFEDKTQTCDDGNRFMTR